ncbi:MAG: hypothetical protein IPG45_37160 [Deltaproteobacteria bacterium]|nr:hypothetical protein [Deltaproteobacteria bacterium]
MVAAAVLAIGMVGILGLQVNLTQSARRSQDMSNASLLLQMRADELSTKTPAEIAVLCNGAAPGCMGPGGVLTAPPASGCRVQTIDPVPVETVGVGAIDGSPGKGGPYIIDVGIQPHPNAVTHPTSRVARISVCWLDASSRFHQIQTTRSLGDR